MHVYIYIYIYICYICIPYPPQVRMGVRGCSLPPSLPPFLPPSLPPTLAPWVWKKTKHELYKSFCKNTYT